MICIVLYYFKVQIGGLFALCLDFSPICKSLAISPIIAEDIKFYESQGLSGYKNLLLLQRIGV